MGLIQTESPYYQPILSAPAPFTAGTFRSDPGFTDCAADDGTCGMAWGARIVDSWSVYMLGTGLYSWHTNYDQTCINDNENDCQTRMLETLQSYDVWLYNLVTVGAVEVISPYGADAIIAANNRNGHASSVLAWYEGPNQTTGARNFTGYQLYDDGFASSLKVPATCVTALTATIYCEGYTQSFTKARAYGSPGNTSHTDQVCDAGCFESISSWVNGVEQFCTDLEWSASAPVAILGSQIWYGLTETCLKDPTTDQYCNGEYAYSKINSLKKEYAVLTRNEQRYLRTLKSRATTMPCLRTIYAHIATWASSNSCNPAHTQLMPVIRGSPMPWAM